MHCVDILFFLSGSYEDMGIFHVFQLSFHGPITDKIDKYVKLPLKRKKKSARGIVLLLFLLFSQIKMWWSIQIPPPPPPHQK